MIHLLLADDQVEYRKGLAELLAMEPDLTIVGQAENGQRAITLTGQHQPDVILMDVRMPLCNGVEATRIIHQRYPWIRILVLSTFDEDDYICQSLQFGALGYLLKSTPVPQLTDAIRVVSQGCSQLGPTIAPKVFSQLNPITETQRRAIENVLSEREREVIQLLGKGKNNKEIAQTLHLSQGTVRNHISRILSGLELRDRTQAALWAQKYL
ncbi:response regulator transcription factor [cf. Phormidesmis sp. LEGE 11477]|uniref:response regulator n=1 Tax=cf. Phormidesmis sp. LEGE 11477 TaxID=1828680 RepID=UPI0018802D1C|nr:response regulator transcription factor [cf. Phormidesmis sp. LEGE 11477]MBE9061523.1 response regulator transcription factor [cf. Phormidesmis sp. LEGE 11477]